MNSGANDAGTVATVRATLDAWRATGTDRANPVRFRLIDALERRAAGQEGQVRRLLEERLAALIADYANEIRRAQAQAKTDIDAPAPHRDPPGSMPTHNAPCRGPLGTLVDLLASRAMTRIEREDRAAHDAQRAHRRDGSPDLPLLDYFRETWSRVSIDKQLRQSLEQVPDNAGPLNSNTLVHRSLALMRALSPGYLQQFLSYVEALSWMEQLAGPIAGGGGGARAGAATPIADVPRAGGAKKRARAKTR